MSATCSAFSGQISPESARVRSSSSPGTGRGAKSVGERLTTKKDHAAETLSWGVQKKLSSGSFFPPALSPLDAILPQIGNPAV